MKTKQHPFWFRALCGFMAALMLSFTTPIPVLAIDIQILPQNTSVGIGFTHRARIQYTDLTNGVNNSQWRLFPGSGSGAAGDVIDRAAIYIDARFNLPQINGSSNGVLLSAGTTGVTNNLLTGFDIGTSNNTQLAFVTNLLTPIIWSAANSNLVITIGITNAAGAALVTSGDVYVYWRAIRFDRLSRP